MAQAAVQHLKTTFGILVLLVALPGAIYTVVPEDYQIFPLSLEILEQGQDKGGKCLFLLPERRWDENDRSTHRKPGGIQQSGDFMSLFVVVLNGKGINAFSS